MRFLIFLLFILPLKVYSYDFCNPPRGVSLIGSNKACCEFYDAVRERNHKAYLHNAYLADHQVKYCNVSFLMERIDEGRVMSIYTDDTYTAFKSMCDTLFESSHIMNNRRGILRKIPKLVPFIHR